MLEQLLDQFRHIVQSFINNFHFTFKIILIFIFIQILNKFLSYRLNQLGILPRKARGLPGILLSPFLHGDFSHLFLNMIPLFILMNFILVFGDEKFFIISIFIIIIGGLGVWAFGRKALHIGASGLVFGYWGYLLTNAFVHFSVLTIILAVICLYYFGGMVIGLFPKSNEESFEGHLFGAVAGVMASFLF